MKLTPTKATAALFVFAALLSAQHGGLQPTVAQQAEEIRRENIARDSHKRLLTVEEMKLVDKYGRDFFVPWYGACMYQVTCSTEIFATGQREFDNAMLHQFKFRLAAQESQSKVSGLGSTYSCYGTENWSVTDIDPTHVDVFNFTTKTHEILKIRLHGHHGWCIEEEPPPQFPDKTCQHYADGLCVDGFGPNKENK